MGNIILNNRDKCSSRSGIVLLVTLVLLVVLSTLGYGLSIRVAAQRHRDNYMIDYQAARYGCDSAVKYALAALEDLNTPGLVARPNEPDFSDLFCISEEEYEQLLAEWALEDTSYRVESLSDTNDFNDIDKKTIDSDDIDKKTIDFNNVNDVNYFDEIADFNDSNSLTVRGPYGPPWPLVTKPIELQIGSATVRIEIEDENAKYPLSWALLDDMEVQREAEAGLETFCEWMGLGDEQIDSLKLQLEEINEIKSFKLDFEPIKRKTVIKKTEKSKSRRRRGRRTTKFKTTTISVPEQIAEQATSFAKFFHSSLIDAETLARPTIISESRKESPLKYTGVWASRKVNINTAPRHVLEAAFTFGGDANKIAEEIIQRRRIKPFTGIEDLRKSMLRYSNSIEKCEKYITTVSNFFTIRVTAVSGVSEASTVIAITKEGGTMKRIAVISG
jgi:DNA uptake protein ComE-like DNA-binding protein